MRRRFLLIGATSVLVRSTPIKAQAPARPRVGFISGSSYKAAAPLLAALRSGLAARGYVEPGTVELVPRFAEGNLVRIPALVRELVETDIKVLVTSGIVGARAAHELTQALPIVVAGAIDIIGIGLVDSLSRPGGHITGLTQQRFDTSSKELELLAELLPGLTRLSVLRIATGSASGAVGPQVFETFRAMAATLGIDARSYEVTTAEDVDTALSGMVAAGSQAIVVIDAPLMSIHRDRIVEAQLPVFASTREYVEAGALASYGASQPAIYYRAAYFVDRILKGAKPKDLPVEQPTTFELIINLRTAKALGLTVPPSLLARADEVIE